MRRLAACVALIAGCLSVATSAQKAPPVDVPATVARVAEYVQNYFARAQSIICDETVRVQSLGYDLLGDQSPGRTLRNELRVSWEPDENGGLGTPQILRTLISVNGRPPRERDRDKCFDPRATSPEVLAIFLPENQSELSFKSAGRGKSNGRAAVLIDVNSLEDGPVTTESTSEGCFSLGKPGSTWWRAWIDVETSAILRLDEHLVRPYEATIPADRKLGTRRIDALLERVDTSITYRPVTFADPDETVFLPASRDTVQVIRNVPSPRMRISYNYKNYRRFMTSGRIVQ